MCYITDRQNETHHCRPYVGHKTKTPAGWDLLGFLLYGLTKKKQCAILSNERKHFTPYVKHKAKPPAAATAGGFLFTLRPSFAAAPHGAVFFVIHRRARN